MRSFTELKPKNLRLVRDHESLACFQYEDGDWYRGPMTFAVAKEKMPGFDKNHPSVELSFYASWHQKLDVEEKKSYERAEIAGFCDSWEQVFDPKKTQVTAGDSKSGDSKSNSEVTKEKHESLKNNLYWRAKILTHFPILYFHNQLEEFWMLDRLLPLKLKSPPRALLESVLEITPNPEKEALLLKKANLLILIDLAIDAAKAKHFVKDKGKPNNSCLEILDLLLERVKDGSAVDLGIPFDNYLNFDEYFKPYIDSADHIMQADVLDRLTAISKAVNKRVQPYPIREPVLALGHTETLALEYVKDEDAPSAACEEKKTIAIPGHQPTFAQSQLGYWFDQSDDDYKAAYEYERLEIISSHLEELAKQLKKLIDKPEHSEQKDSKKDIPTSTLSRFRQVVSKHKINRLLDVCQKEIREKKFLQLNFQSHDLLEKLANATVDEISQNHSFYFDGLKTVMTALNKKRTRGPRLENAAILLRKADEIINAAHAYQFDECGKLLIELDKFMDGLHNRHLSRFYFSMLQIKSRILENIFPVLEAADKVKKVLPFNWLPTDYQVCTDIDEILKSFKSTPQGQLEYFPDKKGEDNTAVIPQECTISIVTNEQEAQRLFEEAMRYLDYPNTKLYDQEFKLLSPEQRKEAALRSLKNCLLLASESQRQKFIIKFFIPLHSSAVGKRFEKEIRVFLFLFIHPKATETELKKLVVYTPDTPSARSASKLIEGLKDHETLSKSTQALQVRASLARVGITEKATSADNLLDLDEEAAIAEKRRSKPEESTGSSILEAKLPDQLTPYSGLENHPRIKSLLETIKGKDEKETSEKKDALLAHAQSVMDGCLISLGLARIAEMKVSKTSQNRTPKEEYLEAFYVTASELAKSSSFNSCFAPTETSSAGDSKSEAQPLPRVDQVRRESKESSPEQGTLFAVDVDYTVWNENLDTLILEHYLGRDYCESFLKENKRLSSEDEEKVQNWHDGLTEEDVNKLSELFLQSLSLRGKLEEWRELFNQLNKNDQPFGFISIGRFPRIAKKCLELLLQMPKITLVCEPLDEKEVIARGKISLLEKLNKINNRDPQSTNNVLVDDNLNILLATESRLMGAAIQHLKTTEGHPVLCKTGLVHADHPRFLRNALIVSGRYACKGKAHIKNDIEKICELASFIDQSKMNVQDINALYDKIETWGKALGLNYPQYYHRLLRNLVNYKTKNKGGVIIVTIDPSTEETSEILMDLLSAVGVPSVVIKPQRDGKGITLRLEETEELKQKGFTVTRSSEAEAAYSRNEGFIFTESTDTTFSKISFQDKPTDIFLFDGREPQEESKEADSDNPRLTEKFSWKIQDIVQLIDHLIPNPGNIQLGVAYEEKAGLEFKKLTPYKVYQVLMGIYLEKSDNPSDLNDSLGRAKMITEAAPSKRKFVPLNKPRREYTLFTIVATKEGDEVSPMRSYP